MFIGNLIMLLDTKNLQIHASTFYDKIKFFNFTEFQKRISEEKKTGLISQ